jgi:serine-type D-Ala-D-Ala endopeptidase (penicillin-binding protein 7)
MRSIGKADESKRFHSAYVSCVLCYTAARFNLGTLVRSNERQHTTLAVTLLALFAAVSGAHATVSSPDSKIKSQVTAPAKSKSKELARPPVKAGVKSAAFLIVDEGNSDVLLSNKADLAMPIASITKLMTALVVLDADQPMDEEIKITAEDRKIEPGSRLVVGSSLTRAELLHLALMSSENRAANAVGRNYPDGLPGLLKAMNAKAKALGMTSSRFADATGLSNRNVASPRDLVRLVNAASSNPTIRDFSTDPEQTVMVGKYAVEYHNTNSLVRKSDWNVVVQKTGFTNAAGQCLVMKTIIDDRPVIMVLMNSFGKYTRVADARRVRKWLEAGERLAYAGAVQTARAK